MTTHNLTINEYPYVFREWLEWYGRDKYKDEFSMYQPSTDDMADHLVVRTPAGWMEFVVIGFFNDDDELNTSIVLSYENVDTEFAGYADDFARAIREYWGVE